MADAARAAMVAAAIEDMAREVKQGNFEEVGRSLQRGPGRSLVDLCLAIERLWRNALDVAQAREIGKRSPLPLALGKQDVVDLQELQAGAQASLFTGRLGGEHVVLKLAKIRTSEVSRCCPPARCTAQSCQP